MNDQLTIYQFFILSRPTKGYCSTNHLSHVSRKAQKSPNRGLTNKEHNRDRTRKRTLSEGSIYALLLKTIVQDYGTLRYDKACPIPNFGLTRLAYFAGLPNLKFKFNPQVA
jgi:hypothetical protein